MRQPMLALYNALIASTPHLANAMPVICNIAVAARLTRLADVALRRMEKQVSWLHYLACT